MNVDLPEVGDLDVADGGDARRSDDG